MKMNVKLMVAVAAASISIGGAANATVLYSTGYDAGGSEVAVGTTAADAHWTITGGSGTGVSASLPQTTYASANNSQFPIGYWVADNATSRWITPTPTVAQSFDASVNGDYQFTQKFTLSAAQAAVASFTGLFAADNLLQDITLNGVTIYTSSTPSGGSDYSGWTAFGDTSHLGFTSGVNTLTFDVVNYAQNGGNPAGLNVQFLSTPGGVPEPATWAMMLVGFGGLGAAMRSQRKRSAAATA